jgi:hypothetical protein
MPLALILFYEFLNLFPDFFSDPLIIQKHIVLSASICILSLTTHLISFHYGLITYKKLSIFLYLLIPALWPKIWSILEHIPWASEKNVCSANAGWCILSVSVKCIWSIVQFNSELSLLNCLFVLDDLSIDWSRYWSCFLYCIWICPFMLSNVCLWNRVHHLVFIHLQ